MRIRRALLFMPGDDRRKIEKGAASGVDSVVMDLEDAVALGSKDTARAVTAAALREVDFGRTERLVRLNPARTELWRDDLAATLPSHPDGYILPKVETRRDITRVSAQIAEAELHNDWLVGTIRLLVIVETAWGIVNLREIATSDPRLDALIFGAEDLAGDIGALRSTEGWEVLYARSAVVLHAKGCGLAAIDTPFVDFKDTAGLVADARRAQGLGYTGKLAIHPGQVGPIQTVFTPSAEEIAYARRVVHAHDTHQSGGRGVFELDGKMIDMPMVRAAMLMLVRARAAGLLTDEG